jgi:hypothetical protein
LLSIAAHFFYLRLSLKPINFGSPLHRLAASPSRPRLLSSATQHLASSSLGLGPGVLHLVPSPLSLLPPFLTSRPPLRLLPTSLLRQLCAAPLQATWCGGARTGTIAAGAHYSRLVLSCLVIKQHNNKIMWRWKTEVKIAICYLSVKKIFIQNRTYVNDGWF